MLTQTQASQDCWKKFQCFHKTTSLQIVWGDCDTYYSRLRAALGPRQVGDGIGQHPGADSRQCRRSARVVGVGIIDRFGYGECKSGEIRGSTSPFAHPTVVDIKLQPFSVCSRHQNVSTGE